MPFDIVCTFQLEFHNQDIYTVQLKFLMFAVNRFLGSWGKHSLGISTSIGVELHPSVGIGISMNLYSHPGIGISIWVNVKN